MRNTSLCQIAVLSTSSLQWFPCRVSCDPVTPPYLGLFVPDTMTNHDRIKAALFLFFLSGFYCCFFDLVSIVLGGRKKAPVLITHIYTPCHTHTVVKTTQSEAHPPTCSFIQAFLTMRLRRLLMKPNTLLLHQTEMSHFYIYVYIQYRYCIYQGVT